MDADLQGPSNAINLFDEVEKRKKKGMKKGGAEKLRMPDRFLRGGMEEQPSTYIPDEENEEANEINAESTGGSTNPTP
jgi:hypothetical protein